MKEQVYLRQLRLCDMEHSVVWRNTPAIWVHTRFRPEKLITLADERSWFCKTALRTDELRLAICLKEDDRYIGNVQLIGIDRQTAEFHLFIGDSACHGKGVGKEATWLMLRIAFHGLSLQTVTLAVHEENAAARHIYESYGFTETTYQEPFLQMQLHRSVFTAY
ncbi:N-acetyltransferase [Pedobacter yulinensis]|uniref:N-acetyltransferase n=1 Tax=Pedobacter yulinensis TaxID=2126353 RepID=A0A2T3HLC5_9SPHI|nr:GNAT family N-acetyltransferase [Pedobacter yulinensis]PST83245.1 N-acetyltransferase [Pedobacter yulinensis]